MSHPGLLAEAHRLDQQYWDGSNSNLNYIKRELKREGSSFANLQEKVLTMQFPSITFKAGGDGTTRIGVEVSHRPKQPSPDKL